MRKMDFFATLNQSIETLDTLLKTTFHSQNFLDKRNQFGDTIIHTFVRQNYPNFDQFLASVKKAVSQKEKSSCTFETAIDCQNISGLNFLLMLIGQKPAHATFHLFTHLGFTALHVAATRNNVAAFECLITARADYTLLTHDKQNILHLVAQFRRRDIIHAIKSLKIPMKALAFEKDKWGNNPFHIAASRQDDFLALFETIIQDEDIPNVLHQLNKEGKTYLDLVGKYYLIRFVFISCFVNPVYRNIIWRN